MFTCNICATHNSRELPADPEEISCQGCHSTARLRAVILALSRALFGQDLQLADFPRLKGLRAMGCSDSAVYAGRLEKLFSYTNTFYDRDPAFDLTNPSPAESGKYDFVIASEVLEHVAPPVERAFDSLARLLRPAGFLILTLPYSFLPETIEHYPRLAEACVAQVGGRLVLVNRTADGQYEVFDKPHFHAGCGSTLEMRIFCEADLRALLSGAGFADIRFDAAANRQFGVVYGERSAVPVTAALQAHALPVRGFGELTEQWIAARTMLRGVRESRWVRLGRRFGIGPLIPPSL